MRRSAGGLFLVLLLVACRPSRESLSAGHVGCMPSDVTISNEEKSVSLGQTSETWVAECKGRMFVCTQADEVSCKESVEDVSRVASESAAPKQESKQPAKPTPPPPGGAGFELGATAEASQKACEGAGHAWEASSARGTCSGAATNVGFDVRVELDLCRDKVCRITVAHAPTSGWIAALGELKAKLVEKYGTPKDVSTNIPSHCRSEKQLAACFEEGLRLQFSWSWGSGETLRFTAGKPEKSDGPAALRLEYARPVGALGADASAL